MRVVFKNKRYYDAVQNDGELPEDIAEWAQSTWEVFLKVATKEDREKVEGINIATWDSYDQYELFTDKEGEHIIAIVNDIGVDIDEIFEHQEPTQTIQQLVEQWGKEGLIDKKKKK